MGSRSWSLVLVTLIIIFIMSWSYNIFIIFISRIVIISAVSWTDIFPGLQPYQDSNEMEDGDPRVGFIQLNSGSTSFNTTLNLTGPILLGLGIAAATLFYAYFNAFNGRKKRSVSDKDDILGTIGTDIDTNDVDRQLLTVLDAIELVDTLEQFLDSVGVNSNQCRLRTVCELYSRGDFGNKVDSVAELVRMVVDTLTGSWTPEVDNVARDWTRAAEIGRTRGNCDSVYSGCSNINFEHNLLQL